MSTSCFGAPRCRGGRGGRPRTAVLALLAGLAWSAAFCAAPGTAAIAAQPTPAAPLFGQPPAGVPNFTGKWQMVRPARRLLTDQGRTPPLNAAGQAEYARRQAALHAGDSRIDPVSSCLLHGVPRLLYAPFPFLILQTTRDINFVHEVNHTFRNIYWDAKLPEDPDPAYLGSSIARLEGRTLVIDTLGFNDQTWLDYSGLPHGEKLRVQERYRLAGANLIQGQVTISDPDFYTASWTARFRLRRLPGMALRESVCMDTHQM